MPTYLPRLLDHELGEVLTTHPAALLVGPRACGKTTTARRLCRSLLRLDVPAQAAVVRADRAIRLPKRYLVDPGLLGPLLRIDHRRVLHDAGLLGRLLDTLVAAQFRAECATSILGADLFHLRDTNGRHEVDLLIEARNGQNIAVEVKATAAPSRSDARHLEWCQERLGPAFAAGLVLHTGPRAFRLTEQIAAVPIADLWSQPAAP